VAHNLLEVSVMVHVVVDMGNFGDFDDCYIAAQADIGHLTQVLEAGFDLPRGLGNGPAVHHTAGARAASVEEVAEVLVGLLKQSERWLDESSTPEPRSFTVVTYSAVLVEDLRPVWLDSAESARNKSIEECQRNTLGKVFDPVRARVCGRDARVSAVGITPDLGAAEGIAPLTQSVVVQCMSRLVSEDVHVN